MVVVSAILGEQNVARVVVKKKEEEDVAKACSTRQQQEKRGSLILYLLLLYKGLVVWMTQLLRTCVVHTMEYLLRTLGEVLAYLPTYSSTF